MPLRLDIKRKLTAKSERVKCVDIHPTEPWLLSSLYNGTVFLWNHETQNLVKTFEVSELPVRTAKFIPRKNWIVTGDDDNKIRVFNYNTLEKVTTFDAHGDYIRCIAVHPTLPYILTCSDDTTIKLWDWEKGWKCIQTFEGHTHYVMMVTFNPKDPNTFASASLDMTVKIWGLGSSVPYFTLQGHEKGVNCVDYYHGAERPYLISGADDKTVKIWDYQNKSCVQTLEGHSQNVSVACYHPELPIILSGSEDGTVRIWHSNTYRLENTLNYGMERVWSLAYLKGSNDLALGYDEGAVVIKIGKDEPTISMDNTGKIIWARHNEIVTANIKTGIDAEVKDGEKLSLPIKELGNCEIFPQYLQHNPNGRFVVVCGDGEYIIYTALAWRNKSFGSALEFVWSYDSNEYAVRESQSKVKLCKNFKEKATIKLNFSAEGIYGGAVLGVRSSNFICFYDWEKQVMIRRIDVTPINVYWNPSGELVVIACEGSYYVLKYANQSVVRLVESGAPIPEDGIEEAFDVITEISETVRTGAWAGDCFIYTNTANRVNYFVGGQVNTISMSDKPLFLLGYLPKENRIYLADKDSNVVSFALSLSVLEYQTAVLRGDLDAAERILPEVPQNQRTKIARFLESQGRKEEALEISTDPEHKFELAMSLKNLDIAFIIASEQQTEVKWKQIADLAMAEWKFGLAEEALKRANDLSGLLLLSTSSGDAESLRKLAEASGKAGKFNVAFMAHYLLGEIDRCIEILILTERIPEAAFMARTYLPSALPKVVKLWREWNQQSRKNLIGSIADPIENESFFPEFRLSLMAEQLSRREGRIAVPAKRYPDFKGNLDRNLLREVKELASREGSGRRPDVRQIVPLRDEEPDGSERSVDGISDNMSMEVNTTGTGSIRGDEGDLLSFAEEDAPEA